MQLSVVMGSFVLVVELLAFFPVVAEAAVVAKDPDVMTGKVKDAVDAGIPVMSLDDFKKKYGVA